MALTWRFSVPWWRSCPTKRSEHLGDFSGFLSRPGAVGGRLGSDDSRFVTESRKVINDLPASAGKAALKADNFVKKFPADASSCPAVGARPALAGPVFHHPTPIRAGGHQPEAHRRNERGAYDGPGRKEKPAQTPDDSLVDALSGGGVDWGELGNVRAGWSPAGSSAADLPLYFCWKKQRNQPEWTDTCPPGLADHGGTRLCVKAINDCMIVFFSRAGAVAFLVGTAGGGLYDTRAELCDLWASVAGVLGIVPYLGTGCQLCDGHQKCAVQFATGRSAFMLLASPTGRSKLVEDMVNHPPRKIIGATRPFYLLFDICFVGLHPLTVSWR